MSIPPTISDKLLEYFSRIEKMASSFMNAINSLNNLDLGNAYKSLANSIKMDTEADALRREILESLGSEVLDVSLREDISRLLRMLDKASEWIKEASRYLDIFPYLEIPQEIKNDIETLSRLDVKAVKTLHEAIQNLARGETESVLKLCEEVEKIEEEADEAMHVARKNLIASGPKLGNIALIIMLRDFIEALENATDYAEDVADILRILALKFERARKAIEA